MTPIERAARAMYAEVAPDWDWDDPDAELLRRMYHANARAALATVRDASAAMCAAGLRVAEQGAPPAAIWAAMIDHALSEPRD